MHFCICIHTLILVYKHTNTQDIHTCISMPYIVYSVVLWLDASRVAVLYTYTNYWLTPITDLHQLLMVSFLITTCTGYRYYTVLVNRSHYTIIVATSIIVYIWQGGIHTVDTLPFVDNTITVHVLCTSVSLCLWKCLFLVMATQQDISIFMHI